MREFEPERRLDAAHPPEIPAFLPASMRRALDWLRMHRSRPVTLDDLAAAAEVRPRTLEAHFRRFLGTTPLGWVRRSRLVNARLDLQRARADANVTSVAFANGFTQLGRFAGEYRRQFGEPPLETLRRSRSMPREAPPVDDEALRLTWRAFPHALAVAPKECDAALADLDRAQHLAPGYGLAKAMAAWCWGQRAAQHFSTTPKADLKRAGQLAKSACELSPNDALALSLAAGAFALDHRLAEADRLIERALALDPTSCVARIRRGWLSAYLGDCDEALRELRSSLHFAPLEPLKHLIFIGIGCAHFGSGRYERAALWVRSGIEAYPQSFWAERILVAAIAKTGAQAEAQRAGKRLMRKDPDLTIAEVLQAWPFRPAFLEHLSDGLEMARLPRG